MTPMTRIGGAVEALGRLFLFPRARARGAALRLTRGRTAVLIRDIRAIRGRTSCRGVVPRKNTARQSRNQS
jgi:hypothetical protein